MIIEEEKIYFKKNGGENQEDFWKNRV